MRKILLIVGTVVILGLILYCTGLYTYVVRVDVQEPMPATMSSSGVKTLLSGMFGKVDLMHKGSGEAKLMEVEGRHILRLENFDVVSGPDLHVYLSKSENPTKDIKSLGNFLDLGPLKGTSGNQNYAVFGDIAGYKTAVIWCSRYGVLFSYAVMN